MVDINKIKARLESHNNKVKNRDKKDIIHHKPKKEGVYSARAAAYPHGDDPEANPFCERSYHYNIPGHFAVYCPKKNKGEECKICDVVWDALKANKGNKPVIDEWRKKLPQMHVFVPVKINGLLDEKNQVTEEGAESFKFLKFNSDDQKNSDTHMSLYKFFSDEPTWMNWDDTGYNLMIEYEKNEGLKAQKYGPVSFKRNGISLARKPSKGWDSKNEYDDFVSTIPNIDEISQFKTVTSEQTVEIVEKWLEKMEKSKPTVDTKSLGMKVESDVNETNIDDDSLPEAQPESEQTTKSPNKTKLSKIEERLRAMTMTK